MDKEYVLRVARLGEFQHQRALARSDFFGDIGKPEGFAEFQFADHFLGEDNPSEAQLRDAAKKILNKYDLSLNEHLTVIIRRPKDFGLGPPRKSDKIEVLTSRGFIETEPMKHENI